MARTIYDVSPDGDEWVVKKREASRASGRFSTKSAAVARGRELAKANRPSQLVVRRGDGTIETEYTYGDDPFPPRG